ncbi:acetolactate synthase isozyme II, large subunit [Parvularcula bermudensis HTCC2503]|uniref:Acetolactate synthase n=1 Tax=Parvularcula bermudensis (strain ATCC BAA-594 / HTCC2503 / KCTC 12087) TaxID=314260 RepID=E0THN4_PARBH|nr:acetolactate synthase 2 catalytic subunit [Parvularcula bermudensis]ADM09330.1 acetolactate synthase isozyme II, large subunit [Parvularcula bermudensis HTCC2503]
MTQAASGPPKTTPTAVPGTRTGARLVVESLLAQGVDLVFGYPGGAIMPVYDALPNSGLRHILCRHEQGAAFSAAGFGRLTGRAGVCFATSGPGATNLVTGIADAYMDSVPMVAVTGQVAQPVMGTDAFQEIDTFGITMPVVKHSYIVRDPDQIPEIFAEAFEIAESGRPGPVLIDIPKDIQQAPASSEPLPRRPDLELALDEEGLRQAEAAVRDADRPLFYLGGGITRAGAVEDVRNLIARSPTIPAVCTLHGNGILPTGHPQLLGMLGMHGARAANLAVQECDLLINIGGRFDDRATGRLDGFAPKARVIHFDRDPSEISKLRYAEVGVGGDLRPALQSFRPEPGDISAWTTLNAERRDTFQARYDAPGEGIFAPSLLKALSETAGDRFVAIPDVGQHQMWVAQHCRFSRPEAHLTSGGLGSMGYSLPTAIGAQLADPDAIVVSISGDGGFMMNIQELATLRRYNIPLKVMVINNYRLGMVRQWQELFFEKNYSEVDLSDNPDFAEIAKAFGIEGFTISKRDEVTPAIERFLSADGPILMHVIIDPAENVWPLVPQGASNEQMLEG